jgi:hypothetical protein
MCPVASYHFNMCIICIDFERGALKLNEARRAFGEMRSTLDAAHAREVADKLDEADEEPATPPTKP